MWLRLQVTFPNKAFHCPGQPKGSRKLMVWVRLPRSLGLDQQQQHEGSSGDRFFSTFWGDACFTYNSATKSYSIQWNKLIWLLHDNVHDDKEWDALEAATKVGRDRGWG